MHLWQTMKQDFRQQIQCEDAALDLHWRFFYAREILISCLKAKQERQGTRDSQASGLEVILLEVSE